MTRRLSEERQVALSLRSGHRAEALTILVGYRLCRRKSLVFQMVEYIQLVLDIVERTPSVAVRSQVVGAPISSFDPVGVVESSQSRICTR